MLTIFAHTRENIIRMSYQSRIRAARGVRHRVVQVSAAPPRPCPLREREALSNHRVGASQAAEA